MKTFIFIFYIQTLYEVACIGSKLTLEISPSLYDHNVFSYVVEVECVDLNDKTFPYRDDGTKTVEMIIFPFENRVCKQFTISIKVFQWQLENGAVAHSPPRVGLIPRSGPTLAYIEMPAIYGSMERKIDLGKYFTLNITPTIQGDAFYDVKVYCKENMESTNQSTVTAKKCSKTGCSAIFFFKRDLCSANEYKIFLWKWKNNLAKESLIKQKPAREYSKLFIVDGQEQLLHYDLADK
uniref:Uncharacterized protein n=1 Tax=Globodera rostochiensis TaxID=31243 RepID=A0A914H8F7_GLORO